MRKLVKSKPLTPVFMENRSIKESNCIFTLKILNQLKINRYLLKELVK